MEEHRKGCDKCIQAHPTLEKADEFIELEARAVPRPDAVDPHRKIARSEICDPVRFVSGVTTIASISL
ncbi:hypothetical protein [Bradyrhizobium sp. WSM2793]|uniref:hypothetical protein n=1 Tax=Bradyrhizobium sp. WSM2793 TaxID=1038866 RepID=UPI0003A3A8AE|nr:hypothetical protein [Bradyrhizobium sp. WSM2793]